MIFQANLILLLINHFITESWASVGDSSNLYTGCYHTCHFNECSDDRKLLVFYENQGFFEKLWSWTCDDECSYKCMWHTTTVFMQKGWDVPQFYGKWPFIRFMGLQEPASVFFSLLNLGAHVINIKKFRKAVLPMSPFYWIWHLYFVVCAHAWLWSTIFHGRDTLFTERMDYFSAFSMVLISFTIFLIRISGKGNWLKKCGIFLASLLFFFYHVRYLSIRKFDYGYNMKINLFVGFLNGAGWLWWSWSRLESRSYVTWCRNGILFLGLTMLLEILDFAPIFWVLDAHALWHLSTVLLVFLWYRFIEGDCYYMLENESKFSTPKKFA